jgi:hypothetical protein
LAGKGRGHTSRTRRWQVLIEQTCHELVYLLLSQSYTNGEFLSDHISRSSISEMEIEHLTSSRSATRIGMPQAVVSQSLSPAKGVNLPKSEFLSVVTRPKTDGVELNYPLDQSGQAWCHLRFPSLLIDERGVQLPVRPLRLNMHINQESLRPRTPLRALEGSIDVLVNAVAAK